MPGFSSSGDLEYYVLRRKPNTDKSAIKTFEIAKFHDSKEPSETGVIIQRRDGSWYSDDWGFRRHNNENASKRIAIAKKHVSLGEPELAAYWIDSNGDIAFHKI